MAAQSSTALQIAETLKASGYRRTPDRIALLEILQKEGRPLAVKELLKLWKGSTPDQTTLYRALESLSDASVITRVDLNSGTARYEYTPDKPHHHHLVCTKCEVVEDIESCAIPELEKKILKESNRFKSIYSHNLEFFGLCTRCSIA